MSAAFWEEYFSGLQPNFGRVVVFVGMIAISWCLTGFWRMRGYLHPADARKINHILALAGVALWFGWLPEDAARGSALVTAAILLLMVAITCRLRHLPLFRLGFAANTRPSDAPHESFYFWSSWLISMLALWLADLFFMDIRVSRTAALIVGISDGLAEPIGLRWGRHRYQIHWPGMKRAAIRSIEGSLCVAVTTFIVVFFSYYTAENLTWLFLFTASLIVALILTFVEALSPHGWDNFTIPITAALVLHFLF